MRTSLLKILLAILLAECAYAVQRPAIRNISISGNHFYSSYQLKRKMAVKESGILKKQRLFEDVLILDIKQIIDLYFERGFQSAELKDLNIEWNTDSSEVKIFIEIQEGIPITVDSVLVEGVDSKRLNDVRKLVLIEKDGRLDYESIRKSVKAVTAYYGSKGYLGATVSREILQEGGKTEVHFNIDEGIKFYFSELTVEGSEKTKDWVIRKDLPLRQGDPIKLAGINSFRNRLYRQGLFSSVKIETESTVQDSLYNLIASVEEKPPGELSAGVGYGSEERARVGVHWNYINMRGRAAALGVEGKISEINRSLVVKHFSPYILQSGLYFNGNAGYTYKLEPDFDRERIDAGAKIGLYLNDWWRTAGGYSFKKTTLFNLPADLIPDYYGRNINQFVIELVSDSRDSKMFTNSGSYLSLTAGAANPQGVLRHDFLRGGCDYRYFKRLGSSVAALQLRSGYLLKREAEQIPLEERFFLGGSSSIRGYRRSSLGPTTPLGTPRGGNFYYLIRCEMRLTVKQPVFTKLFIDNGGLYSSLSGAKSADAYTSAGMGIGVHFGVWTGRVEYAWRIEDSVKPGKLYFQIGQTF